MWRIGIDLGGTKIEGLALGPNGQEHNRIRIPTPRHDYEATLEAIGVLTDHCSQGLAATNIKGVGLGIPGSLSPKTGLVRNANSTWLNGKPLAQDLAARLHWPLCIENDANCFALSEAVDGAGAGYETVFGVILGTGVGGGLVMDGECLQGANGIAGEWGHNPLPWSNAADAPPPACYCGKRGCIETYLCGPALEQQYRLAGATDSSARSLARNVATGDEAAQGCLDLYRSRLARALATVINVVDPDVIVFGGGLSNVAAIFDDLESVIRPWIFSDTVDLTLRGNQWGDSSGVRGAARLIT